MPRKRVKTRRDQEPPRSMFAPFHVALRIVQTTLAVAAILYIAGLFAARTDGFRDIVARRVEKLLGMPVKIEKVSANWRYGLTLRNVVSEGTRNKESPGIRAQRVDIGWSLGDLLRGGRAGVRRLDLDRCVITFARDDGDVWEPKELAPLSQFLAKWLRVDLDGRDPTNGAAGAKGAAPSSAREATRALQDAQLSLSLRRGEISWWSGQGSVPLAAVEGVTLHATPVRLPNRTLTHYYLKLDRAASASGVAISNMTLELLDTGDEQLVLVLDMDRSSGLAPMGSARPAADAKP